MTKAVRAAQAAKPRATKGPAWSTPALIVYAVAIVSACVTPFVVAGNPYPDGAGEYWALGLVLMAAAAVTAAIPRLRDFPWERLRTPPVVFASMVAIVAAAMASVLAIMVFGGAPSTADEIAQAWHARILLNGRLALPVDPNPEFFALETVVDTDAWYSQFPIGAAVLAIPGVIDGMPWLTNAVLAGLSCAFLFQFARRAFGDLQGRSAAMILALAPMMLFMAGTWMNHVAVLCLATAALMLLVEWDGATASRRIHAFAGGIGLMIGLAGTIRPLDAIVVAVVVLGFQLWRALGARAHRASVATTIAGAAVGIAPLLYANAATTGSASLFGYEVLWGKAHGLGFHVDPYGLEHTVGRGVNYMVTYVTELNMYLLAWPLPVMAVIVVGLLLMRRANRWDAILLALLAAQVAAYATYWYEGEFLGPRFLYTALPALVVLVVRSIAAVMERLGARARTPIVCFVSTCILVAWLAPGLPFSARGLAEEARRARPLMKVDVARAVADAGIHDAVVFVREPFMNRLTRRLWGLGLSRPDAARLVAASNGCSLFVATRAMEGGKLPGTPDRASVLLRAADSITRVRRPPAAGVPNDPATGACLAELDADTRLGSLAFGPALLEESIDAGGRLGGDVVYAADLGERNEALRGRFGSRQWYRLMPARSADGRIVASVQAYR